MTEPNNGDQTAQVPDLGNPTLEALDEADRYVRRAMANVAQMPEGSLRRRIELNLTYALDVMQAELEESPSSPEAVA